MTNGWTGGQYSLFRAIFGTYLFVHFAYLVPWGEELFSNQGVLPDRSASPLIHLFPNVLALSDSPAVVTTLLAGAALLSVLFAIGLWDRAAAIGIWYVLAATFGRNPLIANPSLPFLGWMLLAHAFLPPAPYGSWARRGAPDPGTSWRMPAPIFAAAWALMALGYSFSGYTKLVSPSWVDGIALARVLDNPLARPSPVRELLLALPDGLLRVVTWGALGFEVGFGPLALIRRLRPWLWAGMLGMHLGLLMLIDFADLSLGMVMLHLFTFDPGWIRPRLTAQETIFYDGHCGLCHRLVRFVLAEDREGTRFRFAPLGSAAFRASVPEPERAGLPDSLVVRTADGRLLTRSAVVLHIGQRLGGAWRVLAWILGAAPTAFADSVYDAVARIRYTLFAAPADVCPVVPRELRARFDA